MELDEPLDATIRRLDDEEQFLSCCSVSRLITKRTAIILASIAFAGLTLLTVSTLIKEIPTPLKAFLTIFGFLLATPLFYLMYQIYIYLLPPLFKNTETLDDSTDIGA